MPQSVLGNTGDEQKSQAPGSQGLHISGGNGKKQKTRDCDLCCEEHEVLQPSWSRAVSLGRGHFSWGLKHECMLFVCPCCGDVFQAVPPGRDELPMLEVLAQERSRKVKSKVDGVWSTWCLVGPDERPGVHFHGTLKPWECLCMIHCNISCFSKCWSSLGALSPWRLAENLPGNAISAKWTQLFLVFSDRYTLYLH